MLVSSFSSAHSEAVKAGFPDTLSTYGMISGIWTSTFAFGAFVGPLAAGGLIDCCQMRWATVFIVVFAVIVLFVTASFKRSEYQLLEGYYFNNLNVVCNSSNQHFVPPTGLKP